MRISDEKLAFYHRLGDMDQPLLSCLCVVVNCRGGHRNIERWETDYAEVEIGM